MTMSGSAATSTASPLTPPISTGVEDYPVLFAELIRRGWSDCNLAKFAGGNVLRALRRAEAVAASMKDEPAGDVPASRGPQMSTEAATPRRDHPGDAAAAELHLAVVHRRRCAARSSIPAATCRELKAAAEQAGVTIEKILLTHGHIDHCGSAGIFAAELGVPIEGPHEDDHLLDRAA